MMTVKLCGKTRVMCQDDRDDVEIQESCVRIIVR